MWVPCGHADLAKLTTATHHVSRNQTQYHPRILSSHVLQVERHIISSVGLKCDSNSTSCEVPRLNLFFTITHHLKDTWVWTGFSSRSALPSPCGPWHPRGPVEIAFFRPVRLAAGARHQEGISFSRYLVARRTDRWNARRMARHGTRELEIIGATRQLDGLAASSIRWFCCLSPESFHLFTWYMLINFKIHLSFILFKIIM